MLEVWKGLLGVIAKIPSKRRDKKSSFKDLTNYCLGITGHGEGSVLHVGIQNLYSPTSAPIEMEALATENVRCKDPAFHFILSWRELEVPTSEQVDEAVKIALKELDLENCQALWALQGDTQNLHVHVAVNRIDPETGRAIQPAGNWTKKALERAARKIEAAQGWEIEESGRYFVTPEGDIVEKKERKIPEISQKARDIEAHTGAKSAERIAKEIAAPILLKATNWQELHEQLVMQGIRFEQKGSGAVLQIGDTFVKTSQADRTCSFSRLVARLGEFQQPAREITAQVGAVPVEHIVSNPVLERSWKGYTKNRTEYLETKSKALKMLREQQKYERNVLWKRQKTERESLWKSENWKGRGRELNQRRSILAARQMTEKLNLLDMEKQQIRDLKSRYLKHFPSFKTWLLEQQDETLFLKYRYPGQTVLTSQESLESFGSSDIRDYRAFRSASGVAWCRRPGHADFIDCGRRIVMKKNHDEGAILAAMQLACQKWGGVQINGTDEEYRRLCVRVAARHGLKISNPDLGKTVEEARRMIGERDGGLRAKMEIFRRYAEAVGAERFRILVTEFREDGTRAFVLDRKSGGLDGKTADEVQEKLWLLEKYARGRKNINVVPISRDKHHILIDDLTLDKLRQFKEDGYRPSCVIESSPGNFQAILTVPKLGDNPEIDREAANRLTKHLNERYGDPKLSGAVHAHRLPPFGNFKPKHRREDGSYPTTRLIEAEGSSCQKALKKLQNFVKNIKLKQEAVGSEKKAWELLAVEPTDRANDPDGAYWRHYEDIAGRFGGAMDYSQVDGMIGIRMRVTGHTASQIEDAIERNAPLMREKNMTTEEFREKYRYRNWKLFAHETTEKFVFGDRGTHQFHKAQEYLPYLTKLEGREVRRAKRKQQNRGR